MQSDNMSSFQSNPGMHVVCTYLRGLIMWVDDKRINDIFWWNYPSMIKLMTLLANNNVVCTI